MPDEPPFDPAGRLSAVPPWWLEVRCRCGCLTQIPARLLVERHGPEATAPALLARMRCSQCRSPPSSADWIDNPQGGAFGTDYPPAKRVPVL
jgi:hypothetical protein